MSEARKGIVKRSLVIAGHATSISLEEPFWQALKQLASERAISIAALIAELDSRRAPGNLSSALRLFVLAEARAGRLREPSAP